MPFKKGQSGNVRGKTVGERLWREAVLRAVKRRESKDDPQALDKLADALVEKAIKGDVSALKKVGDRLDGKPSQQIEHTGEGGGPVLISTGVPRAKGD